METQITQIFLSKEFLVNEFLKNNFKENGHLFKDIYT